MGVPRFSFNTFYLYGGIGMIEVFIGIFAIAEIFNQIGKRTEVGKLSKDGTQKKIIRWKEIVPHYWNVVKSSVIGIVIGVIPGTGGSIASFIAYDEAKRSSKEPEKFGKGSLEGIAASESANNGVTAATLIPTLTLGIPGNTVAAIFLGAAVNPRIDAWATAFRQSGWPHVHDHDQLHHGEYCDVFSGSVCAQMV